MEALLNKIEAYGFECQGGPLVNCQHWQDLRALAAAPQAPSGQQAEPADEQIINALKDVADENVLSEYTSAIVDAGRALLALARHPSERPAPAGQAVGEIIEQCAAACEEIARDFRDVGMAYGAEHCAKKLRAQITINAALAASQAERPAEEK
jgi:hypothetical protein